MAFRAPVWVEPGQPGKPTPGVVGYSVRSGQLMSRFRPRSLRGAMARRTEAGGAAGHL